jgi:ribosome-binding protein aMBF1 (putative translation factor)
MDGQDWETAVVGKRRGRGGAGAGGSAAARRPAAGAGAVAARRAETEDLPLPTKSLSGESRHTIVTKRVENGWNQDQLNTRCAFPAHTIRDIESGKLCPTPTQLNVLNRVLKTALKYESL